MTQTTDTCSLQIKSKLSVNTNYVTKIILAKENGTRLEPFTNTQCNPAICFGGKNRLIDIPLSNAIHSGCSKIFVISQYLSSSLKRMNCEISLTLKINRYTKNLSGKGCY